MCLIHIILIATTKISISATWKVVLNEWKISDANTTDHFQFNDRFGDTFIMHAR